MLKKITDLGKKIFYSDILSFEKQFKIKLPNDYSAFLLKYNGGNAVPDSYYCNESQGFNICDNNFREESVCQLYFYSLNEIKRYREDFRIPREFLAIANDYGSSNHICIGIDGKYYGKIYYWGYGDYMVAENNYSNIYYITDSFTKLLEGLEEDKE